MQSSLSVSCLHCDLVINRERHTIYLSPPPGKLCSAMKKLRSSFDHKEEREKN